MAKNKEEKREMMPTTIGEILEKVPEGNMYLRLGMFNATTKEGKDELKIDVAMTGGTLVIEVESAKWRKKNKGSITPFRYLLTPKKVCDLAVEAYKVETEKKSR